jgi:short-subunit dehydrogenase
MPEKEKSRPIALVTGASSGIGASYAQQLAGRGHDLVLVARRGDRLEKLAGELESSSNARSEVIAADLVDPAGLKQVESRAGRGDIEVLVNNAGFPGYRPFKDVDPGVLGDLIALHVLAVTRLCRAVVPEMAKRRSGSIINVASLLSLSGTIPANPLPYRATYAGAKS